MHWHILIKQNYELQYIGKTKGPSLEKAIINGMINDHQFKTRIRKLLPLDQVDEVLVYGFPSNQLRNTNVDADLLKEN